MPIRLFFDHDSLDAELLRLVDRLGIDFTTSWMTGRARSSDEDILQFATAEGRLVYSANKVDFLRIHARWMQANRHHAGIIVRSIQQLAPHLQATGIERIADELERSEPTDRVFYLENFV